MTPLMKNSRRFSMTKHSAVEKGDKPPMDLPVAAPSPQLEESLKKSRRAVCRIASRHDLADVAGRETCV